MTVEAFDMATCPWCGRRVPTFPHPHYGRVFEGHRSRTPSLRSVGLEWCQGGGRKVPTGHPVGNEDWSA